jgi:predicted alpha/beta-fold hydrolase
LETVVNHALASGRYTELFLAGISMGGAQTLNYLGQQGDDLPSAIKKAAVYSTPVNLPSSAATLRRPANWFYKRRFLEKLKVKIAAKGAQFPGLLDLDRLPRVQDFDTFDTIYTAKLHGFADAADFYRQVSPDQWMSRIIVPTLVLNALNDPLLGEDCFPIALAKEKEEIFLEMPRRGGHTGFILPKSEFTWAEFRFLEFLLG